MMLDKILNSSKVLLTILFFSISYGIYSYNTLPREADPDISLPLIYVSVLHKGISPQLASLCSQEHWNKDLAACCEYKHFGES